MKLMNRVLGSILLVGAVFGILTEVATAQGIAGKHTLSGTYVIWTQSANASKLETDLKFLADPGVNASWFLAHQFNLADAGGADQGGGYIGLQTKMLGSGKGVMFSIWNATSAIAGAGSTCQPFGGEGEGMQCYRAYPWVAGKSYRLRVINTGAAFTGYVVDLSTTPATETYIGQIDLPPGIAGLGKGSVQWAEHYGVTPANCSDLPYVKAVWTRPVGNGGSVLPGAPTIHYGTGGYCKNSAVIASGTDHTMEAGNSGASTKQNLMTSLSKYVYAVATTGACGGGGLKPNAAAIDACSQLTRVVLPGGKVALQTENGQYLSCTGGGGSTVTATARTPGNYESFTETVSSGTVSYKSYGGRYLTAVNYGTVDFKCSAYFAGSTEKFTPVLNKARNATVTVSSESAAYGQTGVKAIDGGADGYPGDHTREWSTNGQGAGAWIQLNWSASTSIKQIILFDRPNLADQITAGTLTFSNGSSIAVGALPNDGTGLAITFPAKSITWVKFRVDQATGAVGLAEFEAY